MISRLFALFALTVTLVTVGFSPHAHAADQTPFRVGIAPHTSARVIIEQYQPVRQALEKALGVPVDILTAPDFTEFARRAVAQDYDLAVTTGHQARLLETDAGYLPLVTYQADFKSVVVVVNDSKAKTAKDLNGTTVIGLSASSLVTIWGEHWLRDNQAAGVTVRYVSAADSVAQLLLAGDGTAGFMSLANFQGLSADTRAKLRFLAESESMAGRVYMLNGRHAARHQAVLNALLTFAATDEGKRYFDTFSLGGYRTVKPDELRSMDPYADEVRQHLKAPAK